MSGGELAEAMGNERVGSAVGLDDMLDGLSVSASFEAIFTRLASTIVEELPSLL